MKQHRDGGIVQGSLAKANPHNNIARLRAAFRNDFDRGVSFPLSAFHSAQKPVVVCRLIQGRANHRRGHAPVPIVSANLR